jgi:hypothetical protein
MARTILSLLYVGPDQIMPLTSVFGAIVGVILMFWGRLVSVTRKGWMLLSRRGRTPERQTSKPS